MKKLKENKLIVIRCCKENSYKGNMDNLTFKNVISLNKKAYNCYGNEKDEVVLIRLDNQKTIKK
jgi:hypothetical protein